MILRAILVAQVPRVQCSNHGARNLGLRMALGARLQPAAARDVAGLGLTVGGVVLGATAALGLTRLIGSLLFKVDPTDPVAFESAGVATRPGC